MAAYTITLSDLAGAASDYTVARKIDGIDDLLPANRTLVCKQLAEFAKDLPQSLRHAQCIVKTADMRVKPALMIMIGFFSVGRTSGVNVRMYYRNGAWSSDLFKRGGELALMNADISSLRKTLDELT